MVSFGSNTYNESTVALQAFRKLAGKSHLQGLLLQAIGKSSFGVFISSKPLGNFAFATRSDAASSWETIGKILCKLLGTSHFKGLSAASSWDNSICSVFLCSKLYWAGGELQSARLYLHQARLEFDLQAFGFA